MAVLKIIGIVLLVILALILLLVLALFTVPIRYQIRFQTTSQVQISVAATWLLHLLKVQKGFVDDEFNVYIFGRSLKNWKRWVAGKGMKDEKESYDDIHVKNSKVSMVDDYDKEATRTEQILDEEYRNMKVEADFESDDQVTDDSASGLKGLKENLSLDKVSRILDFLRENRTKSAIKKLIRELVQLVHHLAPRKVQGKVEVGLEDPYHTGLIVGGISLIPFAYTEGLIIRPNFEEKVFSVDGVVTGRAGLFFLLRMVLRVYRDPEIRSTFRQLDAL